MHAQFPEHPYGDLLDKVLLYRHSSDDVLVPLEADDPIEDGSIVEIVLRGKDNGTLPVELNKQTVRAFICREGVAASLTD